MLLKPKLAKCGNRSETPKSVPEYRSPEIWFSDSNLSLKNLHGLSFDFFVNWTNKPPSITRVIWIKRILDKKYSYDDAIKNLEEILVKEFTLEYLIRITSFVERNKFKVQLLIYLDNQDWSDKASELLIVEPGIISKDSIGYSVERVSIEQLQKIIKEYSGGPISVGHKGLTWGTSELECFLSHTNSLYPGDVDLVLLNDKNEVVALLEFKKHTLSTSIEDQKLSNYYPRPDQRKYDRLAILKEYLGKIKGQDIPLINIYYPTKQEITKGKCEVVKGSAGSLTAMASRVFELPVSIDSNKFVDMINHVLDAVAVYSERMKTQIE